MTIAQLSKVTLVGHADDKDRVLDDLQDFGQLHVLPATAESAALASQPPSAPSREALKFLLQCPQQRRQVVDHDEFNPVDVEARALDLQSRLHKLRDERDFLKHRIADLEPWGNFALPPLEDVAGQRLWFYVVPPFQMKKFAATGVTWAEVHRDNRFHYIVVLSERQPEGMPVPRTHTGQVPRDKLVARLDRVEFEIEDLEADRARLTRWCTLLARNLDHLEDHAARRQVAQQTADVDPLFALQAWAPVDRLDDVRSYATGQGLALEERDPEPSDEPPTLLENPDAIASGEQLVTFYRTPGYFAWDPSSVVFVSFTVFFAMIVSDAGYALLIGALVGRLWKRMGHSERARRMRTLFASLAGATFVYGVLTGSYFGEPPPTSFLASLKILDLADSQTMMAISVVVGVAHLVLANLMDAHRFGARQEALPPVGWAAIIAGGFALTAGKLGGSDATQQIGLGVLIVGGALVLLFSGAGQGLVKRVVTGLLAFTRITKAFGDVLSYLRLFALGLATASLAGSFNEMAGQVHESMPGVGLFLALLVLVIGHALNLILGVASGVIHGLRLNVIEFLDWGVHDEGKVYRPFRRRETV